MMKAHLSIVCILFYVSGFAQNENNSVPDSTKFLTEFTLQAYQYNRPVMEVPAAVGVVQLKDLNRYSNTALLPALNALPGVRMEERSPGSYRLALRGSSLRAPFGVRNVKIYWNDLPYTDAGGNTYLNSFDFSAIQNIEVIKGPSSSLYGAGTGGTLLLRSSYDENTIGSSWVAGSFGLLRYNFSAQSKSDEATLRINYAHQESDGYRRQSRMIRDAVHVNGDFQVGEKGLISMTTLYSDLFYETPGGLTGPQVKDDPRQARPAAGPNPGAEEQHAAIFNKTFYSGISYHHQWNDRWSNQTGVYGSITKFDNPTLRPLDYERRTETGFGGRTNTTYSFLKGRLNFGAEFQHGFSPIKTYESNQGQAGALQHDDEITIDTYFLFAQTEFDLPAKFFLTIGASLNKLDVSFMRFSENPSVQKAREFDAIFSPRVALLKKLSDNISAYASFSRGYSPPTIQELYASDGRFNRDLNAEMGNNYEVGFKGDFFGRTVFTQLAVYDFQQHESIVRRTTEDGGEYFVNAGKTNQVGIEMLTSWSPKLTGSFLKNFSGWISYTYNNYKFKDYEVDGKIFDGNDMTGIAPQVLSLGLDALFPVGVYTNITFSYTDRIPLNDANEYYDSDYSLLGVRAGYVKTWGKFSIDIFGGVDNALNEEYSLGHELNAVGFRFYNPAPTRNYFFGVKAGLSLQKNAAK